MKTVNFRLAVLLTGLLGILTLYAIGAAGAHANGSEWMAEGETFEALGLKEESISITGGPLSLAVPKLELTIECTGVEGTGKLLKGGTEEETLTLSKCKVTGLPCEVSGTIAMKTKSEVLTEGSYEKLQAPEGLISTITFKEGTGCPIALKQKLTGTVADEAQTLEKEEEADTKRHLAFSKAITEAVNAKLKEEKLSELSLLLGESAATLTGSVDMSMSGGRAGNMLMNTRAIELCEAENKICPGTQIYQVNQMLVAKSTVANVFKFGTSVTCNEVKLEGKIANRNLFSVTGQFETVAFNSCTAGCTVKTVTGWSFMFANTIANKKNGWLGIGLPTISIKCVAPAPVVTCQFGLSLFVFAPFDAYGGQPATFNSFPHHMIKEVGTCANGTWESTGAQGLLKFEFTTPNKMFVTGTGI